MIEYIVGTIKLMYGAHKSMHDVHSQTPPASPGGGEGGGAKCGGIQRGINWANLVVPVVEDNSGFSSRRSRVVAEQE